MKTATAIIGAAWGDEGKGHLVDYYASMAKSPIVVRYCGGANAGHTVETPEGVRHVFGHFGAGTLVGAPTFLSKFFLVNPILWKKEAEELSAIGVQPRVMVDPEALLSTPYDMIINQLLEKARGGAHHGSVGVGINETMVRSSTDRYLVVAEQLTVPSLLRRHLKIIRDEYVPARIDELGLELTFAEQALLSGDGLIDAFLEDIQWLATNCDWRLETIADLANYDVIFEGSQGLLLDAKNSPFFPHVTNARTGAVNMMEIAGAAGIDEVSINYVTRAYATRHGAGPFPGFEPGLSFVDKTNVRNEWQGQMRFGWLDFDLIEGAIMKDLAEIDISRATWSLAMTCLNQVSHLPAQFYVGGELIHTGDWLWEDAANLLRRRIGGQEMSLNSVGKTRQSIAPIRRRAA